jgi:3-hydroxyacyl-[acyl-carrier-protein] dehydratase
MIESAAQLCSYDYLTRHHKGEDVFLGFGGTNETRFRGLVQPPGRMVFVGEARRVRRSLFTYYAQGFLNGALVFESEILGIAV